ncbi:MAG: response regulator transcription factor [Acidobacteria bacterium]|nr:response regulator transcription factor [Acidobacteriota bacterium]
MSLPSVLVIEDEPDILSLVSHHLQLAGFTALQALTGGDGLKLARSQKPSLVILDLMLPDTSGQEVFRQLKADPATHSVPVLMLTARAAETDRVQGLELGADDYVTKPFSPRELILRVKGILRRVHPEEARVHEAGHLKLDLDQHRATWKGKELLLTVTEFSLLVQLIKNRGRVQTRESLLNQVWGYTYYGGSRTVDTHVRRLREKLGPANEYIETVRGVGYRFMAPSESA